MAEAVSFTSMRLAGKRPGGLESTFCRALGHGRKQAVIEKHWRKLFSNTTESREHRLDKPNRSFPDLKHKKHTDKALWRDPRCVPGWAAEKLAAIPPATIQSSTFSWNERLSRCAQAGQYEKTMELFQQMQRHSKRSDRFTFLPVIKACANLGLLEFGRQVHRMMPLGFEVDLFIGSTLVDMYAKCGSIEEAESVFKQMPTRNVVTMNAMIGGYVKCGEGQKALDLFEKMQGQGVDPSPTTFVGVLSACASVAALKVGRRAHEEIVRRGYESNVFVGTCLVDMYAKCGRVEEAERLFKQMPTRNVVAWTALINGYVKCGEGQKALELFEQMQVQGVNPNSVTFVGVLNACASVAALEGGRRAHEEIVRRGHDSNVVVVNSLLDMYAKCGSMEEAEKIFNKMPTKNVVAWTAMLVGYGIHGNARGVLEIFEQMSKVGQVDGVTFTSLLSACSHGGLVAEGLDYFKSMSTVYNITPTVEHFGCVVDLLGRAGRLREAEDLIMSMPMDPNVTVWMALLGACRAHVNVEVGERCVERVLELDPDNISANVLISNIYVATGKFNSSARLHGDRLYRGVEKIPGLR